MNTSKVGEEGQPCQRNDGAYDDEDHDVSLRIGCGER